jgi:tRNA threonylcarbamoyladenosine biosynthesis protein TsaE
VDAVGPVTPPAPTLVRSARSGAPADTHALGERLGRLLLPGDFVGLEGDLGAGKTHLVRGVAQGAGVAPSQVASPTFAIVYPYQGRLPLYHADFYRLAGYDELYATGFMDLVDADGAVLVEWVGRVPEAVPRDWLRVHLEPQDDEERLLTAVAYGARPAALLDAWLPLT